MRPADPFNPSTQRPLEGMPAGPGASKPAGERKGRRGPREFYTVDLRGLAPRLKAYSSAHGRTRAASIRLALMQALDAEPAADHQDARGVAVSAKPTKVKPTQVTLSMSADHVACLTRRARAAERSRGGYVSALLDGTPPAPMPENHDAAIQALRGSTDHLAVLSTDLNGFLRSVGHVPIAELQRYRASLVSVVEDVRQHLVQASALIAEIQAARRGRR